MIRATPGRARVRSPGTRCLVGPPPALPGFLLPKARRQAVALIRVRVQHHRIGLTKEAAATIGNLGPYFRLGRTAPECFLEALDPAIALHNTCARFADGDEFGFSAEAGVATGRIHARGPVSPEKARRGRPMKPRATTKL